MKSWVRELRNSLNNEKGMTLIEMLVSLFIFLMISSILYSFLLMGISIYKSVTLHTQMRNQGDALFSQVITELKDAVYVEQVKVPSMENQYTEILYLKQNNWFSNPTSGNQSRYIERFRMRFDKESGAITVQSESELNQGNKVFKMTDAFQITETQFIADDDHKLLKLSIAYQRSDAKNLPVGQSPVLEIQSQIPLFRIE